MDSAQRKDANCPFLNRYSPFEFCLANQQGNLPKNNRRNTDDIGLVNSGGRLLAEFSGISGPPNCRMRIKYNHGSCSRR